MHIPNNLLYSKDHEWLFIEGDTVTIGITSHAQEQLGDVVFVEMPAEGDTVNLAEAIGVVESTKAVSDIYSPVAGTVLEVNPILQETPEKINEDPYGDAWLLKVKYTQKAEDLMDADSYKKYIEEE
jgi:glycine cleavage system H protein